MSHSCDEYYDIYNERARVANKEHDCCACDLPIRKGDKYTYVFILYDGCKENYKRCARCQFLHEHLRTLAPGEMWPDEQLGCGTLYDEEWGPPPQWVDGLAFWRPGDPLPAINSCESAYQVRATNCWMRHAPDSGLYFGRQCHSYTATRLGGGSQVCT